MNRPVQGPGVGAGATTRLAPIQPADFFPACPAAQEAGADGAPSQQE